MLFASLRRTLGSNPNNSNSNSSSSSGGGGGNNGGGGGLSAFSVGGNGPHSSSQRANPADHVFAAGAPAKRPKGASEGTAGGGSRSGAKRASALGEAEGLTKEGRADIQGLRGAVLRVAESVPVSAWRNDQWLTISYPAWRAFVRSATGPRDLMQVR